MVRPPELRIIPQRYVEWPQAIYPPEAVQSLLYPYNPANSLNRISKRHDSLVSYRGTHIDAFFRRASSAAHTNDRGLITVDLFCCTGVIARQVPEAGSEVLSRVIASGREVLTRGLMAGDDVLTRE